MRVITGTARGRKLREPKDDKIRPTTDKIKESVFNIVQFDIEGRQVLDLFAGTGQLGIEALSRGAAHAVFTDTSPEAIRLTKENLQTAGLTQKAEVLHTDALACLAAGRRYDLVFADPPYDTDLLDQVIQNTIAFDILKENGIMICESRQDKPMPDVPAPYRKGREYKYGKIKLTLYRRDAD